MKTKFSCVDMKHKSAEKIHEIIADFSIQEELEFWKEKECALKERKDRLQGVKKLKM